MIEGIRILSQSPIFDYTYKHWYVALGGILGAIVLCFVVGILSRDFSMGVFFSIIGCVVGICLGVVAVEATAVKTETGRYEYKVLIEDGVEMKEFYERYNVIKQDGEIWVIEDKESVE